MTTLAKFQLLCAALLALGPLAASPLEGSSKPYVVLDQTLSQLRADFNANVGKLRMLYMSGYTDSVVVSQGIEEGGSRFLAKPFTPQVLVRKVREVLDGGNPKCS